MNQEFYIIENGVQAGPFSKLELPQHGLTPDSMVWTAGMADWQKAASVAALSDLFMTYPSQEDPQPLAGQYGPQQPYGQQPYGQPYGQQPYGQPPYGQPVVQKNRLTLAIIATVLGALFSCIGLIFGIVAIVNANKATRYYQQGAFEAGDAANKTAKTNTIIALVLAGIGLIGNIMMLSSSSSLMNSGLFN